MNNSKKTDNYNNGFWQFIVDYLPNYSSRDDVLWDDILTRFIADEDVSDADMEMISAEFNCDKKLVKKGLAILESEFAKEALMAYFQLSCNKQQTK